MKFQRILCPVDFSRASEAAAEYAVALAQRLGAGVAQMHAVYAEPAGSYGQNLDLERLYGAMRDGAMRGEASSRMRRLQVRFSPTGVPTEPLLYEGPVVEELRRAIGSWQADLVVMPTHGRRDMRRWALGSTADALLRDPPVPLLTLADPEAQRAQSSQACGGGGGLAARSGCLGARCDASVGLL